MSSPQSFGGCCSHRWFLCPHLPPPPGEPGTEDQPHYLRRTQQAGLSALSHPGTPKGVCACCRHISSSPHSSPLRSGHAQTHCGTALTRVTASLPVVTPGPFTSSQCCCPQPPGFGDAGPVPILLKFPNDPPPPCGQLWLPLHFFLADLPGFAPSASLLTLHSL